MLLSPPRARHIRTRPSVPAHSTRRRFAGTRATLPASPRPAVSPPASILSPHTQTCRGPSLIPASSETVIPNKHVGFFSQVVHFLTPIYCFAFLVLIPVVDSFQPGHTFSKYFHVSVSLFCLLQVSTSPSRAIKVLQASTHIPPPSGSFL